MKWWEKERAQIQDEALLENEENKWENKKQKKLDESWMSWKAELDEMAELDEKEEKKKKEEEDKNLDELFAQWREEEEREEKEKEEKKQKDAEERIIDQCDVMHCWARHNNEDEGELTPEIRYEVDCWRWVLAMKKEKRERDQRKRGTMLWGRSL